MKNPTPTRTKAYHPQVLGVMYSGEIIERFRDGKTVRFRFDFDPHNPVEIRWDCTQEFYEKQTENPQENLEEKV